jgi:hypothetical protein
MMSADEATAEIKAPELVNPDLVNQDLVNPDFVNPELVNPDLVNAAGGMGNTTRSFEQGARPREDLRASDAHLRPVEDLHNLLLRISHHLDFETSERTTIYHRLRALDEQTRKIVKQTRRRRLRTLARFLAAILIGVAATLAWQAYGEDTKGVIATRAPELGWSPQSKQVIAGFVQELGWTKESAGADTTPVQATVAQMPQAVPVTQALTTSAPFAPAVDPEQVQAIVRSVAAMRQSLDQIASGQDQMAREVVRLQNADAEILAKIPAPAPGRQSAVAAARKPVSAAAPGAPRPLVPPH